MVLLAGPVCSVGEEMYYSQLVENDASRSVAEANALMSKFEGMTGYDPVPTLQVINTPTVWLLGLEDRSIPVERSIENLARLKASGRPFEWRTYEGLGHSLGPQIWPDIERWIARFR